MKRLNYLIYTLTLSALFACQNILEADLIVHNAKIYTVDSVFSIAEAMAIKDGKILEVGPDNQIKNKYRAKSEYDAKLQTIFPGFIDGHCHFLGYGLGLSEVNLVGTNSWEEALNITIEFAKDNESQWIIGRGWDQNDWEVQEFPTKKELDSLFPNKAVLLERIDGHAAIANQKAFELAEVDIHTTVEGGILEIKDGEFTGILIDNAVGRIRAAVPSLTDEQRKKALIEAEANCFSVGLTTLSDAGTDYETAELIKQLHKEGSLKIRVYAMLSPSGQNKIIYYKNGPFKSERLNIRSFKYYADGALGSRGALLKNDYSDELGNKGILITDSTELKEDARKLHAYGFQMNTHCIGDKANQLVTDLYSEILEGKNDLRWRIEHAQVVSKEDLETYRDYNIIPSVQPTHATSDMYWIQDRLGEERAKTAYAFKDLLEQNGLIALGTDFPVEDIDPIKTFYAAVVRKDAKGYPKEGFQMENALSREETLKGMTIWNAIANFEESEKGSLEKGKFADFIVLDKDLMSVEENQILSTKVAATYINGEKVFER